MERPTAGVSSTQSDGSARPEGGRQDRAEPLPTGTLTFLFTDIEGSTRLVQALGTDGYGPLLERHRALLRDAFASGGGVEVGTEGDSFFVVFPSASRALAAAIEGQRALAAEPWPAGASIRVRMGLHTGEGRTSGGTYVGSDVHRAARIAAAGHGGQVLLSATTRALVQEALPAGVGVRDLGEHRLKDLRPERLVQLEVPGLENDFPPIRSLDRRPNNLPTQLTSFVGRDRELTEAIALLETSRLLTLTGPGGTGKTRLALQLAAAVADRFPDGLWFVALEPIRDPTLVASTIARTLGLADSGSRPAAELVAEAIGTHSLLLVLDNFEQVVEASPVVADLLRACPNLAVVATSRAALRVSGEQEFAVPGLPTPPDPTHLTAYAAAQMPDAARQLDPDELGQYEAVRLFIARALAVRPEFRVTNENAPAVAGICARLQGMPLAIELAAARVKLLTPDAILVRLQRQLDLLASGGRDLPERQRTLRGAIAWSYDLLDEGGRRLLDRLSVFVGGCDLAMAERVCGPADEVGADVFDGLAALADQSLLRVTEADGESRFEMLETIRSFASERLETSGEAPLIRRRHAEAFLELAETAAPHLSGADQREWLDRLERDHDNLRAALEWAVAQPEPEIAARLGFALWRLWQQRGYLNEARERLEMIRAAGWQLSPVVQARLLEALGGVYYWQADHGGAKDAYSATLAIWRSLGDKREIANALYNLSYADIQLMMTGQTADADHAVKLMEEALGLTREAGDRAGEANILWALGSIDYFLERLETAERWFDEGLAGFRATGHRTMESWALHMLGAVQLKLGRLDEAVASWGLAFRQFRDAGDLPGVTMLLDDFSAVAVQRGDLPRAARLRGAARHLQASSGAALAAYVEEEFETRTRPSAVTAMSAEDLERYGAEGAAMPLDEVMAYALDGEPEGATAGEAQPPPAETRRAGPPSGGSSTSEVRA
ncbi:MAG TPA: adenylate/guanylate cyclase domain-containing protein [Candidatus Dormibacteraeota bacterium]|nr:adenylate/guanylate cyclase domain-containing protein [Candidatus Dormibacteraeota bacterium]